MRIAPLGLDENRAFRFSKRVALAVANVLTGQKTSDFTLATTGTAQSINLFTAPKGTYVRGVALWVPTLLKASGDAAFDDVTVIVGDAGDDDRLVASTQIAELNGSPVQGKAHPSTVPYLYLADTVIVAKFTPKTGKALSALDVGRVDLFFDMVTLPNLIN